ncbi:hypothetical protein CORC01_07861 [Colletotrichum orchidophilum]|uniref:Uncharacterized protein n=1 Tax=Colletotrichum orchidophilum TaxID=1209926 RepID=A0A1G4B669_9PEZI|nr:uncharacterized protein CORC01_07861 [Colletotrichum orchidophilum]OHE96894.1 hypothetical protein CORC01_07861 [Colletotrichum orchidophilum]
MLAGRYRLHWFAVNQWIHLLQRLFGNHEEVPQRSSLLALLASLTAKLKNYTFRGEANAEDDLFAVFGSESPEISQMIGCVVEFRRNVIHADWNFRNGPEWINLDPLVISHISLRLFQLLDKTLCNEATKPAMTYDYTSLQRHYGTGLFRCIFPQCNFNRHGFATGESRDRHIDQHTQPWSCPRPSCEFAPGFATKQALSHHSLKWHGNPVSNSSSSLSADQLSETDVDGLAAELIRAGDVEGLKTLLQHLKQGHRISSAVLVVAARMGSLPMVTILTQFSDSYRRGLGFENHLYEAVLGSENVDLFRWLLNGVGKQTDVQYYWTLAALVTETKSPDIYAEWEDFIISPMRVLGTFTPGTGAFQIYSHRRLQRKPCKLIPQHNKRSVIFSQAALQAAGKNAMFEARLIHTWHRLIDSLGGKPLDPQFLGWSLTDLARCSKPSITLAAELLRLGAPVNFPREVEITIPNSDPQFDNKAGPSKSQHQDVHIGRKQHKGITALHYASRGTSEQAAQLVRLLLQNGANPSYGFGGVKPEQEPGSRLIKKWLGETWEELVMRTSDVKVGNNDETGVKQRGQENRESVEESSKVENGSCPGKRRQEYARESEDADGVVLQLKRPRKTPTEAD